MKTYVSIFQRRMNELYRRASDKLLEEEGERLTQVAYAKRIGTTLNSLRGWMSGVGQPDADGLARIAEVEHVTVDWLVGKSSAMQEVNDEPQRARLIKSIRDADLDTLSKLEQFYNYLEWQKSASEEAAQVKMAVK